MKVELIKSYHVEFTTDEMQTLRSMLQEYADKFIGDAIDSHMYSIFKSFGIKLESGQMDADGDAIPIGPDNETLVEKALRIASGKRKSKLTNRE